jgi:membrane protein YqaA with SNARE-associated domain
MSWLSDLWHGLHEWLSGMLAWVEAFAGTPYGGWALFGLAFLESSVFPIPPDVLLIALSLGRPELAFWFALVCSIGSVLGGMAGYALGYYGGRPLLLRMFPREKIENVERYYDKYNAWAIGIAGLTPLPYKLFTISAGAFAINFKIFVLASIISRTSRFMLVAGLIYVLGEPAKLFIEKYLNVLTIAFVVLLVLGFWIIGRGASRAGKGPDEALDQEG